MKHDIAAIRTGLEADVHSLAKSLFPNRPIKSARDGLRIGTNGSLAIKRRGLFYCHESGCGGDVLDLIQYALATDFRGALLWANAYLGGNPAQSAWSSNQSRTSERAKDEARKRRQIARAKSVWMQVQSPDNWGQV